MLENDGMEFFFCLESLYYSIYVQSMAFKLFEDKQNVKSGIEIRTMYFSHWVYCNI